MRATKEDAVWAIGKMEKTTKKAKCKKEGRGPKAHKLASPDFLRPVTCDYSHATQGKWPF